MITQMFVYTLIILVTLSVNFFLLYTKLRRLQEKIRNSRILSWEDGPQQIKVKKVHKNAQVFSANDFHKEDGSLGLDLVAAEKKIVRHKGITYIQYNTGLAFEVPELMGMFAFARSSLSNKNLVLSNSVGVIDRNYRGELLVRFKLIEDLQGDHIDWEELIYQEGDRVIQVVILMTPPVEYVLSAKLSDTARGEDGFGSTGA